MGQIIVDYFKKAKTIGGFKAEMRMSILTKILALKASETEESTENINKCKSALAEIEKEFK